jgi:hypothetical protein
VEEDAESVGEKWVEEDAEASDSKLTDDTEEETAGDLKK